MTVTNEMLADLLLEMMQKNGELMKAVDHRVQVEGDNSLIARSKAMAVQNRLLDGMGKFLSGQLPRNTVIENLGAVEFSIFSQWGEDGIIEWLISHIPVPNHRFVEFGVENFTEANCRFLQMHRNWKGLVFDGSEDHMQHLRSSPYYWKYDLTAAAHFITKENIDSLIAQHGFAGPLGILSIDIDGNDYWVWEEIQSVDPAIVILEYNPHFGDVHAVTTPYQADFDRMQGHYSGYYFGASIAALMHLADEKGYVFLGTNSNGCNAFFVRRDLSGHVLPLLKEQRAFPARYRDSRDEAGTLTQIGGTARFELIKHLPVIEVTTGREVLLGALGDPYSADWRRGMD